MDPTGGLSAIEAPCETSGTRDHVPVHVCFQGLQFGAASSDALK